jgi:hypothetical protein
MRITWTPSSSDRCRKRTRWGEGDDGVLDVVRSDGRGGRGEGDRGRASSSPGPGPAVIDNLMLLTIAVAGFAAGGSVGVLIGVLSGRKRRPKLRPCSCEHGYGYHQDGGRCHEQMNLYAYHYEQCPCRHFDGELPLDVIGRIA